MEGHTPTQNAKSLRLEAKKPCNFDRHPKNSALSKKEQPKMNWPFTQILGGFPSKKSGLFFLNKI